MTQMSDYSSSKSTVLRYLPLVAIAAVALVGLFTLGDVLSFETLRENRETLIAFRDANRTLTVAVFILCYLVIVAFSLPGAAVATLTGGFLFGLFPGVLYNVIGATSGAVVIFLAARWGLGDALKKKLDTTDGRIGKIKKGLDENQWAMLFFIRLVPVVPFFVANLIPALLNVPLWKYVVSTFLGILPGALVYTSVGSGLGAVFAAGESPDLGIIFEPHILWPILGLSALSLLPILIKAVTGKKDLTP